MTDEERFNLWLMERMRKRRMTQRQLAYHAGVDHSTICRILKGEANPKLGTALRLARVLGRESFLEVFGD